MPKNDQQLDSEWNEAFNEEYGTDLPTDVEDEEVDTPAEGQDVDQPEDDDSGADKPDDDKSDDEDASGGEDTPESDKEDKDGEEKPEAPEKKSVDDEPEEKFVPKDVIKEALRELDVENRDRNDNRKALQSEVIEALFPGGLDRQLRDSAGDPIKSIDDLTSLINPKTSDYFTEEEAAEWMLQAQQKVNRDIEEVEKYALDVVDAHLELQDGSKRVEALYGDLLESMPDVADKLLAAYEKTLIKHPKTGLILKAPLDVVEFYTLNLEPYQKMSQAEADAKAAQEKADKEAADKAAKAEQLERGDIVIKGSDKPIKNKGDREWDDAYEDYYNG